MALGGIWSRQTAYSGFGKSSRNSFGGGVDNIASSGQNWINSNRTWVYIYRIDSVEYRYIAPNRAAANTLAKADEVPSSAFVAKY